MALVGTLPIIRQYTAVVTRVETTSGAIYQFTTHRYADGSERTLMLRMPGRDGNTLASGEQYRVERWATPNVGVPMTVAYEDPWDGETRSITSSDVVRVESWLQK